MRSGLLCAGLLAAGLLQAQAAEYRPGWLGAPDVAQALRACVPSMTDAQVERWRKSEAGQTYTFADESVKRYALASGDVWACVESGEQGFPKVPRFVLEKGIRLSGFDDAARERLLSAIQDDLAREGLSRNLVVQGNGKRALLYVSTTQGAATALSVQLRHVAAGEVAEKEFPRVIDDQPNAGVESHTFGGDGQVPFLAGVLAPRPMVGEYLWSAGSPATDKASFESTTWRSVRDPAVTITFEPGGVLTRKHRAGVVLGAWRKEGATLYFYDKQLYHSAQLGDRFLMAETRRPPTPGNPTASVEALRRGFPEQRGRAAYFRVDDGKTAQEVRQYWTVKAQAAKASVESQRQQRLNEAVKDEGKHRIWSLCSLSAFEDAPLVREIDGTDERELCRPFVGTRTAWQDIVRDGCHGRCLPTNLPSFDTR